VPEATPTFLTFGQIEQLIGSIEETWMNDVVLFAISTGLRRGELCMTQ
jgi:integrase